MLKQEQRTTLERKIERFSQILADKPDDGLTGLALAEASFRRGLKLEALTAYQIVTREKPVPEAHLAVAEIYSQQDMIAEAYGEIRKLFELEPDNVEARLLARKLEQQVRPPEDIADILNRPTDDASFLEARLRLQIQRAIHNRELQERTRNVSLEPGEVIHEYYVEEAMKKLIEVDERLRALDELKLFNATLEMMPEPETLSAEAESENVESEVSLTEAEAYSAESDEVASEEQSETAAADSASIEDSPAVESMETAEAVSVEESVSAGTVLGETEESAPEADRDPVEEALSSGTTTPDTTTGDLEASVQEDASLTVEATDDQGLSESLEAALPGADQRAQEPSSEESSVEASESAAVEETAYDAIGITGDVVEPELPTEHESFESEIVIPDLESFDPPSLGDLPEVTDFSSELDALPTPDSLSVGLDEPSLETDAVSQALTMEDSQEAASVPTEEPVAADTPAVGASSFDLDFSISEESPVEPDLPAEDIQPYPIQKPEPLPIQILDEETAVPAEPTMGEPESVVDGANLDSGPDMIELGTAPADSASAAEPDASSADPEPPATQKNSEILAAERQAFYESKAEELGKLTGALARTRGVTSIFLVARDGKTIDSEVKDNITEERVGELVRESFDFLLAYAKSPAYWVLECNGGIFVMQTLDEEHVLIAIGQAGANFGALRYTMDKTKTKFGAILQDVPQ